MTLSKLFRLPLLCSALVILAVLLPPHVHPTGYGLCLALAALIGVVTGPPGFTGRWSWLLVPVALLVVNFAISSQRLATARTIAFWLACYFLFDSCRRQGRADRGEVTLAVVFSGTALALHGLYQSLIGFDAMPVAGGLPEALQARIASGRAVAGLGLPGALAGFLSLSLPLTLCRALSVDRRGGERLLAWIAGLVQIAGLAATRSAAGVASLAVAGALVVWWGAMVDRHRVVSRRLAVALLVAGIAAAGVILALRFSGPGSPAEGAGPLALRAGNWKVAAMILADHPLLGAGAGCYGIVFPQYRTWEMNESRFAHNSYLQVLAECGLPLGLAALALAGLLVARLRALSSGPERADGRYIAVSCLAFLLHNLVDFTFFLPTTGFAFVALAGVVVGRTEPAGPSRRGSARGRTAAALLLAAFAILVTRADQARLAARDAVSDPAGGDSMTAEAVRANRWDPEARSLRSHLLLEQGLSTGRSELLRESEEQARRAVDLDPLTPHHWHHLGRVRLARRDPVGAFIAMQRAVELYPIKIEYREDRDRVGAALAGGMQR